MTPQKSSRLCTVLAVLLLLSLCGNAAFFFDRILQQQRWDDLSRDKLDMDSYCNEIIGDWIGMQKGLCDTYVDILETQEDEETAREQLRLVYAVATWPDVIDHHHRNIRLVKEHKETIRPLVERLYEMGMEIANGSHSIDQLRQAVPVMEELGMLLVNETRGEPDCLRDYWNKDWHHGQLSSQGCFALIEEINMTLAKLDDILQFKDNYSL